MSHELRTPLNAIIGFADLMCQEVMGPLGHARYGEYARDIGNSGELLLAVIAGVLDIAKLEAGKLELSLEEVDVAATIGASVQLMQMPAANAGVALEAEGVSAPLMARADARALKQIALNLLSNAIKFTKRGGRVSVTLHEDKSALALVVRDTGIGIPQDQIARLGKAFEQVCVDPLLAKNGVGLGLALVQALAQGHGGRLTIESTPGAGTTATVELPRGTGAAQSAA